jgi:hypothetical protein
MSDAVYIAVDIYFILYYFTMSKAHFAPYIWVTSGKGWWLGEGSTALPHKHTLYSPPMQAECTPVYNRLCKDDFTLVS